jgi:DNA modification methylase
MTFSVLHGDCLDLMPMLGENSVDSIVTDPPYGLSFMGKDWDHGVPGVHFWQEALKVLKPGGYLLAFGGTRTFHRLAVAIEDAGFELRDTLMWVYGSGFPKSLDISKAIEATIIIGGSSPKNLRQRDMGDKYKPHELAGTQGYGDGRMSRGADTDRDYKSAPGVTTDAARQWEGWGTALKPAYEPIILARKPLIGTVAANVLAHGTGGLNIDGCRVEGAKGVPTSPRRAEQGTAYGDLSKDPGTGSGWDPQVGRWPSNLIHDGSDEVLALFPDSKGQQGRSSDSQRTKASTYGALSDNGKEYEPRLDAGSAARFFYCAKASRADRDEGLDGAPLKNNMRVNGPRESEEAKTATLRKNHHPTVKPTDLMRYLCRLITPPGGIVLDPFTGSGSTGKAAVLEGFGFIGCELQPEYVEIALARIGAVTK